VPGFTSVPKDKVPDAYGSKPHLVFTLIDDFGWSDSEFGGSGTADFGRTKTPVMKSLEKDSVHLNRHYAYSWCAPSRSSLLSGRLPVHVNVNHSVPTAFIASMPDSSGEGIPAGMTTVGSQLQTAGYRTHYVGKWGVGATWKGQNPVERGFNSFFGYLHDSIDFWDQKLGYQSIEVPGGCEKVTGNGNPKDISDYTWWADQPLAADLCRVVDGAQVAAKDEQGKDWIDYQFLDESKKIIDAHKSYHSDKPLFLLHSFHSIHAPLNAPGELYTGDYAPAPCGTPDSIKPELEMKDCFMVNPIPSRNSYAAMVTWTDKAIGEIIDKLKGYDMWKKTLLVSSADNGGAQYFSHIGYQLWGSGNNLPLRGGKTSEWEGGLRVNSFVTGGVLAGSPMLGKSSDSLMQFADWYGTFSYLAGIPQTDKMAISKSLPDVDSINQWPAFWSDAKPRDEIHVSPVTLIAGKGKWKLLTGPDPGSINEHTQPGYVPFSDYGVGYYNGDLMSVTGHGKRAGPPDQPGLVAAGGFISTWATTCDVIDSSGFSREYGFDMSCPGPGMDCREGCLFDLDNDPEEMYNVAEKYPDVLAMMKEKMAAYGKKWDPANPSQGGSYTNQGIFNPIRNGATKDCKPGVGMYADICGSDYCSDSEWAYDPSCYPNCKVCPPQEPGCKDDGKDDPKKIALKGCTSPDTCHKFTHETGFYSWVAPSAGP
jgi:arylsulfatase I/J